jgi:hypothetical protein
MYLIIAAISLFLSHTSTALPFIKNNIIWGDFDGEPVIQCEYYDDCFPKKVDSTNSCPLRCLLTSKGYGVPDAVNEAFKDKFPPSSELRPAFIVAYGPPASGKSKIQNLLMNHIAKDFSGLLNTTVDVNVDRVFQAGEVGERFNFYRQEIKKAWPTDAALYTQRLVNYVRWAADQIADNILNQALAGRMNVTWETTGSKVWWIQREINRIRSYGYEAIIVYPLVKNEDLLKRAQARTEQEAAPPEKILKNVKDAQENLISLLPPHKEIIQEKCLEGTTGYKAINDRLENNKNGCRSTRVILIDNSGLAGEESIAFDTAHANQTRARFFKMLRSLGNDLSPKLQKALMMYFTQELR